MLDFIDRELRRRGGRKGAEPSVDVKVAIAAFGDSRNVRQRLRPRAVADGKRPQAARFQIFRHVRKRCKHRGDLLAQDGVERWRVAGYGTNVISTFAARLSISKPS